MFHKPVKLFYCLGLYCLLTQQSNAQVTTRPFENLPYSRYGLGEEMLGINPALKSMASTTAAFADEYIINTENPASYASIRNFTYEAGLEGRRRTIASANASYQTGTLNFNYLTMAIPMGKYAGMAIGYRPYTKISYSLFDTLQSQIGPTAISYNGNGSTNYFFVGLAGKYQGLSIGANVGYIFGNINENSWYKSNSTAYYVNNSEFLKLKSIGGIYIKTGLQYELTLKKDYTLSFGAQASLKQNLKTTLSEYWIAHPFYASDTAGSDTSYALKNVQNKLSLPGAYSFGIQLKKGDQWALGLQYQTTQWSQYNNYRYHDSVAQNSHRISIGAYYTPDALNIFKYWKRVSYRAGLFTGKDFVQINGVQNTYYGASLGLSLPFRRSNDRILTSFEMGKIGNTQIGNIQQNFYKLSIGVSLNDRSWFIKRKYD